MHGEHDIDREVGSCVRCSRGSAPEKRLVGKPDTPAVRVVSEPSHAERFINSLSMHTPSPWCPLPRSLEKKGRIDWMARRMLAAKDVGRGGRTDVSLPLGYGRAGGRVRRSRRRGRSLLGHSMWVQEVLRRTRAAR